MKKLVLFFLMIWGLQGVYAQTYSDGCMDISVTAAWAWNEEYEDPFDNDESNWQWWLSDDGNVDGLGWQGGVCLAQCCSYQIGWWNHSDALVQTFVYGSASNSAFTTPQFLSLRGHYEGDDCGGSCDKCTSLFGDDDYRYDETVSGGWNYRFAAPNANNLIQFFTNWHGSSDYGGEFIVNYTSPRPNNAAANPSTICSGAGTSVTLSTSGGAIHGGTYEWYTSAGTFVGTGSSITVSPTATTTYRVFTRNNGTNSKCWAEVSVTVVSCNFNCTTPSACATSATYDVNQNNAHCSVTTSNSVFPSGSYLIDVNPVVTFNRPNTWHQETMFELRNGFSCANVSLVDPANTSDRFLNGTAMNGSVTFDEDVATSAAGTTPVNGGTYNPAVGNLNQSCFMGINTLSGGLTFTLRAGDGGVGDPITVNGFTVTACGCKPPVTGSLSATTPICQGSSTTLTHSGSQSSLSANGYGDELRWYTGSCGGTYIGSGLTLNVSPSTTTTYYCNWYYKGRPCGGSTTTNCQSITITVNTPSVGGTVAPASQSRCVNVAPGALSLSGYTGTISSWQVSTDGGGTWSNIGSTAGLTSYTPPTQSTQGVWLYQAVVQNGACPSTTSSNHTLNYVSAPVAGTATVDPSSGQVCTGVDFALQLNGFNGNINWQVSTAGAGGPFNDISGEVSQNSILNVTNAGPGVLTRHYRARVYNSPCSPDAYSNVIQVDIYPTTVVGSLSGSNSPICVGGNSGTITLSGYVGSILKWQTRFNGGSWSDISNTSNTYSPGVINTAGTYEYRAEVQSGPCTGGFTTPLTVTVALDPTEPFLTKSPNVYNVCQGSTVTVTVVAGYNGAGTCNDEYRYSTDNGTSWTSWSGTVPSITNVPAGNTIVQSRRDCNGAGCLSNINQVSWVVDQLPTTSSAGADQIVCNGVLNTVLNANTASVGLALWSQTAGPGTSVFTYLGLPNTAAPNATVSVSTLGTYTFRWRITNGACPPSDDFVQVLFNPNITFTATLDECAGVLGGNKEFVLLNASGGTSPLTFSTITSGGTQEWANATAPIWSAPMTGSNHTFRVTDGNTCTKDATISTNSNLPTQVPFNGVSSSGNTPAQCFSRGYDEWLHFKEIGDATEVLVSIDDNGDDLGLVNVTCYKDATDPSIANSGPSPCTGFPLSAMRRHFVVTSSIAPVSAVDVRLYFTNTELNQLIAAAAANGTANYCPDDDYVNNINDLYVTKYTGANEDGIYSNNAAGGLYRVFGNNQSSPGSPTGPLSKASGGFDSYFGTSNGNHYVQFSVTEFSEMWIHGSEHNTPLPVELIYLEANPRNNSYIELKWATSVEINNDGFVIERSTDGIQFTAIGWKEGNDNSSVVNEYMFNDQSVQVGQRYYYRLKQLDNNGQFEYTPIVSAILISETVFNVYPNPAQDNVTIYVTSNGDFDGTVEVTNAIGEIMLSRGVDVVKGSNHFDLNTSTLAVGTYFVSYKDGSSTVTKKLNIVR